MLVARTNSNRGDTSDNPEIATLERIKSIEIRDQGPEPVSPHSEQLFSPRSKQKNVAATLSEDLKRQTSPYEDVAGDVIGLVRYFMQGTIEEDPITEALYPVSSIMKSLAAQRKVAVARCLGFEAFGHLLTRSSGASRVALISRFTRQTRDLGTLITAFAPHRQQL